MQMVKSSSTNRKVGGLNSLRGTLEGRSPGDLLPKDHSIENAMKHSSILKHVGHLAVSWNNLMAVAYLTAYDHDLAECKLVSFPIGIYKVLRNVSDQIHLITLANNELKSLTSKFMTTFSQLRELRLEGNFLHRLPNEVSALQHLKTIDLSRNQFQDFPEQLTTLPALEIINLEENKIVDVPVEKLATMPALRSINLRFNPLNAEVRVIAPPLIKFDMLMSPEGAQAAPP
ncbi:leucine-rich repeat-containing protein 20 isoform X1 [Elephas maximus indicus]|uniref:leucine-rich repeat-containing protein 20 isoform X1 n=2 Tax=Elephas maximus indicus TaxID=99487 RepID=UPI00211624C4|nr:leucine-rich repeat-containing protein 20 isoform X1 [Elephas maximus indicus]